MRGEVKVVSIPRLWPQRLVEFEVLIRIAILLNLFFLSDNLLAQAQASARFESRAAVLEPIQIERTLDLDFGNVFKTQESGSLTLTPEGIRMSNGVPVSESLPGRVSAAGAVITHSNNSYAVNLPTSIFLVHEDNPGQMMKVEGFTLRKEHNLARGKDVLYIGATVHLDANLQSGHYSALEGFRVTVSYN